MIVWSEDRKVSQVDAKSAPGGSNSGLMYLFSLHLIKKGELDD